MQELFKLKDEISVQEFDSSNIKKTYLLSFGSRNWQIDSKVFYIAKALDGKRSVSKICDYISEHYHEAIDEQLANNIIECFFKRRGLLIGYEEKSENNQALKHVWFKIPLLNSKLISKFSFLSLLFNKSVMLLTLPLIIITFIISINSPYFTTFNIAAKDITYFVLVVIMSTLFHELGHATAVIHFNLKPGDIGFGFYLIYPVCYSDVSEIWKLKRKQRVIVDLGGLYLEFLYLSIVIIVGIIMKKPALTTAATVTIIFSLINLNPFLKMDGYWALSSILGVSNLHSAVKNSVFKTSNTFINDTSNKTKFALKVYSYSCIIFLIVFTIILIKVFTTSINNIYTFIHTLPLHISLGFPNVLNFLIHNLYSIVIVILFVKICISLLVSVKTFFEK